MAKKILKRIRKTPSQLKIEHLLETIEDERANLKREKEQFERDIIYKNERIAEVTKMKDKDAVDFRRQVDSCNNKINELSNALNDSKYQIQEFKQIIKYLINPEMLKQ